MSTRPIISKAHISKLLRQELVTSEQLKQLLAAEQQAITGRDIPAFEEIVDKKQILLERLSQYEQERILLLESGGIKHGPESMADYMKRYHDDGTLSGLWKKLLSVATDCRDHNRRNYLLVELCSTHTRNALCVLRGEALGQNVYGPDGDTSDSHENRSLAIA